MKIKSLNILSYGKINDFNVDLGPGINIFYGPNEAGKTTISSFIFDIFYGGLLPGSNISRYTKDYESRRPWNRPGYEGSISVNYQGKDYYIYRNFLKNQESLDIRDLESGQEAKEIFKIDQSKKVERFDENFFGISEINLRNTFLISSKEDKVLPGGPDIKDLILGQMQTNIKDLSLKKILDRIDQAYLNRDMEKTIRAKRRDLKKITEELSFLSGTFEYEKTLEDLETLDLNLEKLEARLQDQSHAKSKKNLIENPEYLASLNYQRQKILVDIEDTEESYKLLEEKLKDFKISNPLLLTISILVLFLCVYLKTYWPLFSIIILIGLGLYRFSLENDFSHIKNRLQNLYSKLDNILEKIARYEDDRSVIDPYDTSMGQEIKALSLKRERLLERLRILDESKSKIQGLKEDKAKLEKDLEDLDFWQDMANLSKSILNDLVEDNMTSNSSRLIDIASSNISYLSQGAYDRLLVSDESGLSVRDARTLTYIDLEDLSRATIEQVYFSYKLALVASLDVAFPLLIDDGFAFYDKVRKSQALKLIGEYSKHRQILFFTSNEDDLEELKTLSHIIYL